MIAAGGDVVAIGGVVAGFATLALCMTLIRRWVTDTNEIRREYRAAIRACDLAREENQVATAITMGERERARSEAAAAKAEARQAEVNFDQRSRAAERHRDQEIAEAAAHFERAFEEKRAHFFKEAYGEGVIAALSGQIDMVVLDAPDADVIELDNRRDERRPTGTDGHITRP